MECDACYTNHMKAYHNDIENLAVLLAAAGCNYFKSIPCGDDIMINYQCTGYQETPTLRQLLNLNPIDEFRAWCIEMGFLLPNGKLGPRAGDASVFMK